MTAKRILIVEDEKSIRDMVAFGLRRAGYDVREAEDCRGARACIADVRPDLPESLRRTVASALRQVSVSARPIASTSALDRTPSSIRRCA